LGADAVITLKNTSSMVDLQVNIDGREVLVVMQGEEITVSKSNRMLKMITFGNIPTFTTLRTKMELAELKD
jgi:NAD kinase